MRRAQFADTFDAVLNIDNFPRGMSVTDITVFIMSDTYIGLDQEVLVGNTDDKRFYLPLVCGIDTDFLKNANLILKWKETFGRMKMSFRMKTFQIFSTIGLLASSY